MLPDDLHRELARKTAKSIVDHGSIPMATLKESIILQEKVEENNDDVKTLLKAIAAVKGDKGDKGDSPTEEELLSLINPLLPTDEELQSLIQPLIPEVKDGEDYVLTEKDKKDIAKSIKVPVVEKIIEKTETIIEKPIVKEVAIYEEPEEIASKLNKLTGALEMKVIKGLESALQQVMGPRFVGGVATALARLFDVGIDSPTNGQVLVYNSSLGKWVNGTIYSDTITGTIDGVNTVFTVANSISTAFVLFLANSSYQPGVDFTTSGTTVTFVSPPDSSLAGQPFWLLHN